MTEEEKKAIKIVDDIAFSRGIRQDVEGKREDLKAIKDVFRLVDNKQKEIELYIENNAKIKELNEEEIKAIETVKQYKKCFVFETVHEETGERLNDYSNAIDIVLNLIEKQQKEIEELKERLSIRKEQQETILVEKIKTLREEKIELIHNFEEGEKIFKKEIKSLLKEIEELKEKNKSIVYNYESVVDKLEESISKDKIREKIKKYEKLDKEYAKQGNFETEISLLKELLEE